MNKTFDKTYLTEELGLPYGEYAVSDTITNTGRWNIEHELIFLDPVDNKYYRTSYRIGATERPWEHDETVEAVEVEKKLVIEEEIHYYFNALNKQPLSQESVKAADIDMKKFQKFCKKLKKKLSNVFDEQHETNLNDLSDSPAVDDVLEVYCGNNKVLSDCKTLSYNLLGLYQTYLEYKKNQAYKPEAIQVYKSIEAIVDSIADDYEACCAEMEAEEELD